MISKQTNKNAMFKVFGVSAKVHCGITSNEDEIVQSFDRPDEYRMKRGALCGSVCVNFIDIKKEILDKKCPRIS